MVYHKRRRSDGRGAPGVHVQPPLYYHANDVLSRRIPSAQAVHSPVAGAKGDLPGLFRLRVAEVQGLGSP